MGYIIEVDDSQLDVGWDIETFHVHVCVKLMQSKSFKVSTSSTQFMFELCDDVILIMCSTLDLKTLLNLSSLNKSRCPTVLSGFVTSKIVDLIIQRYAFKRYIHTEQHQNSIIKNRYIDYSLYNVEWRMLSPHYFYNTHDENFVIKQYKFFHTSGYLIENSYKGITYVGKTMIRNLNPEQFLDMYEVLDHGNFDKLIVWIVTLRKYDYQSYLFKTQKKYTFKHFVDLLLNLDSLKILEKYADVILKEKIITKDLGWLVSDDIVSVYGIRDSVIMYGGLDKVIKNCENVSTLSSVCSYINQYFTEKKDMDKYLNLVSRRSKEVRAFLRGIFPNFKGSFYR